MRKKIEIDPDVHCIDKALSKKHGSNLSFCCCTLSL